MKYIVEIPDEVDVCDKLVPFDKCRPSWWEEAYSKGADDAWGAAKKLLLMSSEEVKAVFPNLDKCSLLNLDCSVVEAIGKITEYVKEPVVGDELYCPHEKIRAIVAIAEDDAFSVFVMPDSGTVKFGRIWRRDLEHWHKTGRRFPQVADMLEALKGE